MIQRLREFPIHPKAVRYRNSDQIEDVVKGEIGFHCEEIGFSREGRAIYGYAFGSGPRKVSITAGCHADEPIGPMTAQSLFWHVRDHFPELLDDFQFRIVPNINPDGAERNRPWFDDPIEVHTYMNNVIRELPGDDIEFGFGREGDERSECVAAMKFFENHGSYAAHFSLHGLAYAEGAWCLICKEWQEKAGGFMADFAALCAALNFPQHDIDRKGDKGFHRIGKGYTTTPHSEPMKQFFMEQNDPVTAAKFKPTSMQFIQSLGGDPLCMVSELPLFHIGVTSPDLNHLATHALKEALTLIRAKRRNLKLVDLEAVCEEFELRPTPIDLQIRLQTSMIVLALQQALDSED